MATAAAGRPGTPSAGGPSPAGRTGGETLAIRDLRLAFQGHTGFTEVLHGISLDIAPGERVALVGESGSGKSVTARIVLGLLQSLRSARISGAVSFEGRDLESLPAAERSRLRGTRMTMIFQDPTSSLNPVYRIEAQFEEVLKRADPAIDRVAVRERSARLLAEVSIDDPDRVLRSYPFQLSGGMNQRVMIAMALANEPSLLIADEPGTALDVTVQARTLELMRDLVETHRTAVLFISHNLGVVREFADRVYVIYRGRIVEEGPTASIFGRPRHAYTRALMAAVPRITGGGLPEIESESGDFMAPRVVHDAVGDDVHVRERLDGDPGDNPDARLNESGDARRIGTGGEEVAGGGRRDAGTGSRDGEADGGGGEGTA